LNFVFIYVLLNKRLYKKLNSERQTNKMRHVKMRYVKKGICKKSAGNKKGFSWKHIYPE